MIEAIKKGADRYGSEVQYRFGRGKFIGTEKEDGTEREQRDSARNIYQTLIDQSPVQGSRELWGRVHDRWGEALATTYREGRAEFIGTHKEENDIGSQLNLFNF
jgi:hypothetical protein